MKKPALKMSPAPMPQGMSVRVEPITNGFLAHHTPPGMGPTQTVFHKSNPLKGAALNASPVMPKATLPTIPVPKAMPKKGMK